MAKFNRLDKISSLPKEVICEILKRLTIREAAATSNLSRTWRYTWMSIQELVFNEGCALPGQTHDHMINFVNNVLFHHDDTLTKFEIHYCLDSPPLDMSRWLIILSRKKLNILSLKFKECTTIVFPSSLLLCQDLRELLLGGCVLQLPPRCGFNNLTNLSLVHVTTSNETIEFLVTNSPFLKHLILIVVVSTHSYLNINAPNLEECFIHGPYGHLTLTNTPELTCATIKTWLSGTVESCRLEGVLGGLVEIHELNICHPSLEFVDNLWERLPCYYMDLCHLKLDIGFGDTKQIMAAYYLIRRSPSLESVSIKVKWVVGNDTSPEGDQETQQGEGEDILPFLERFHLHGFRGSGNELGYIRFVLQNAPVLRTMEIKWNENYPSSLVKERVLVKLLDFQRNSTWAKIVIPN